MSRSVARHFVPVYGPHTPTSHGPDFFLPYADAKALVCGEEATFVNRATAIRLKKLELPKLRGVSCRMSPALILAFADGQANAVAIVEGWMPNHRAHMKPKQGQHHRKKCERSATQ